MVWLKLWSLKKAVEDCTHSKTWRMIVWSPYSRSVLERVQLSAAFSSNRPFSSRRRCERQDCDSILVLMRPGDPRHPPSGCFPACLLLLKNLWTHKTHLERSGVAPGAHPAALAFSC